MKQHHTWQTCITAPRMEKHTMGVTAGNTEVKQALILCDNFGKAVLIFGNFFTVARNLWHIKTVADWLHRPMAGGPPLSATSGPPLSLVIE